jgi:L-threonylcarbamoyladenylate synthase
MLGSAEPAWLESIDQDRGAALAELAARNEELAEPSRRPESGQSVPERFADDEGEPVEVRPYAINKPLEAPSAPESTEPEAPAISEASPATESGARVIGRRTISPEEIDVFLIEEAVDCLLEGGVIAFPTETVYGLAADATNPAAVERLFQIKGRTRGKAITLMVDSPKMLAGIARNLTVEARRLMEAFRPGPLTIIFQKRGENFNHVSTRETIGVRMPDHSVPLAIIQELSRPLACTSANLSGQPEAASADEVELALGPQLNLILDAGRLPERAPSTVVDLTAEPYRILRQGDITADQLAALIGDKLDRGE